MSKHPMYLAVDEARMEEIQRSFVKLFDFMMERHPDIDGNELKEKIAFAEDKLADL